MAETTLSAPLAAQEAYFIGNQQEILAIADKIFPTLEQIRNDVNPSSEASPEIGDGVFYLGSGSDKDVFSVTIGGQERAIKFIRPGVREEELEHQTAPLLRAEGLDGFEQLVGVSPDRRIIITTLMPGEPLHKVSDITLFFSC